jgi:CheY-like chemotaxis protein
LKARDGAEAVETFERHQKAVALLPCDLGLSRMSGWEAFRRVLQIRAAIRVILMTGQLSPAVRDEINRAGAAGFPAKPWSIPDAVSEVRARLGTVAVG